MKTIYLDIDGVLANFVEGSIREHMMDDFFTWQEATHWDYFLDEPWNMTREQFFKGLDCVEFWESLPLHDGANGLVALLRSYANSADLVICTTLPKESRHAATGKLLWLEKHFGFNSNQVIFTKDKWRLANEDSILIDDNEENTRLFLQHGGSTVTVPRPWNRYRGNLMGLDHVAGCVYAMIAGMGEAYAVHMMPNMMDEIQSGDTKKGGRR